MAHEWQIVEKKNPLSLHALCHSRESAERWIRVNAPMYCERGYFTDKTLTPDSFEIRDPVTH